MCALTFPGFCVIIPSIATRLLWMWSFSMCFYIKEKEEKSGSSKQYSNLPYIEPSDTVSGDEWCECVFACERVSEVCLCLGVCVRLWEPIYQHVLRTYVCSNNYAAMYNLVCYLNSTSTVHWFLSLCLQLHTECNGCSNYRRLVFCPQRTYRCKDLSSYYYWNSC